MQHIFHRSKYIVLALIFGATIIVLAFSYSAGQPALAQFGDPWVKTTKEKKDCYWKEKGVLCTDGDNAACRSSASDCRIDDKWDNGPCYTNSCTGGMRCGNNLPDPGSYTVTKKRCHYIDEVIEWSECSSDGIQVALDVHWTSKKGDKCKNVPFTKPCVVDGVCGTADGTVVTEKPTENLCESGVVGDVVEYGDGWIWTCGTVSCSATIETGDDDDDTGNDDDDDTGNDDDDDDDDVGVVPNPDPKNPTITANPNVVDNGGTTTIAWTTDGALDCEITSAHDDPDFDHRDAPEDGQGPSSRIFGETVYIIDCPADGSDIATVRIREEIEDF